MQGKLITYNGKMLTGRSGGILMTSGVKYLKFRVANIAYISHNDDFATMMYGYLEITGFEALDINGNVIPLTWIEESYLRDDIRGSSSQTLFDGSANPLWKTNPIGQDVSDYTRILKHQLFSNENRSDAVLGAHFICAYEDKYQLASYRVTCSSNSDYAPSTWHLYISDDMQNWEIRDRHYDDYTIETQHTATFTLGNGVEKILGRYYPVADVGNQRWIATNLDYSDPSITLNEEVIAGDPSTDMRSKKHPASWYFDWNETLYGICGRLYNGYCIPIINAALTNGWRVATEQDWRTLFETAGGTTGSDENQYDGIGAIRTRAHNIFDEYYKNKIGTNQYGFSLFLRGGAYNGSNYGLDFGSLGSQTMYITATERWGDSFRYVQISENNWAYFGQNYPQYPSYIRLVKDIT